MESKFLLIGEQVDINWIEMLARALAPLGSLSVLPATGLEQVDWQGIRLVFVDALSISDMPKMIRALRQRKDDLRIIVVTYSPTWTRALEAKQAGASQYVAKSLGEEDVRKLVDTVLKSPVPPLSNEATKGEEK